MKIDLSPNEREILVDALDRLEVGQRHPLPAVRERVLVEAMRRILIKKLNNLNEQP